VAWALEEDWGVGPEQILLPIGKTLWYTLEGTGGPVTIGTARSDCDTIPGVSDADLNQITCIDDVGDDSGSWSLQPAATVETTPGEMHFVQVGGLGCLRLRPGSPRTE